MNFFGIKYSNKLKYDAFGNVISMGVTQCVWESWFDPYAVRILY